MPVKVEGNVPIINRVSTGLYSLDRALAAPDGTPGMPIRGGIEIYGRWETGKSTLAYYLSGRVHPTGTIALIDLEGGARRDYLVSAVEQSGFDGSIRYIEHRYLEGKKKGEPRMHEEMLAEGANMLLDDDVWSVVLDSAAVTQPIMERDGEAGKQYIGRRAQTLAQFTRRWLPWITYSTDDKLVITVNHMLQSFDAFGGKYSPGGDTPKYGILAILWIRRKETLAYGAFEAEVKVEKLRFGGKHKGRKGRVLIVPGVGVSPELTAVFDCMGEGLARRGKGTGMVEVKVTEGDEDVWLKTSKLSTMISRVMEGKKGDFKIFFETLEALDVSTGK